MLLPSAGKLNKNQTLEMKRFFNNGRRQPSSLASDAGNRGSELHKKTGSGCCRLVGIGALWNRRRGRNCGSCFDGSRFNCRRRFDRCFHGRRHGFRRRFHGRDHGFRRRFNRRFHRSHCRLDRRRYRRRSGSCGRSRRRAGSLGAGRQRETDHKQRNQSDHLFHSNSFRFCLPLKAGISVASPSRNLNEKRAAKGKRFSARAAGTSSQGGT